MLSKISQNMMKVGRVTNFEMANSSMAMILEIDIIFINYS